jgi:hypothetical protein
MKAWNGMFRSASLPSHGYTGSADRTYRLPSNLPGAMFTASIAARWMPADQGAETVFAYLGRKGAELTSQFSVLDPDSVRDALNIWFSRLPEMPNSSIRIHHARVTVLAVPDEHRDFAQRMAAVERQANVETAGMEATRKRLTTIRELFLSDSPMARLWWSKGEPDRLLSLNGDSANFESIVDLVSDSPGEHAGLDQTASLIDRFLADLGPDHRQYLLTQLAKVFVSYQRPDLADELGHPD